MKDSLVKILLDVPSHFFGKLNQPCHCDMLEFGAQPVVVYLDILIVFLNVGRFMFQI